MRALEQVAGWFLIVNVFAGNLALFEGVVDRPKVVSAYVIWMGISFASSAFFISASLYRDRINS